MNTKTRERLDQLLNTEMDRKAFLKYCAVALLSVIGISGLIHALNGAVKKQTTSSPEAPSGYVGRAFGE
ncbi:hypothetical protein CQ042_19780 [Microbacterium sp. MYb62]|nr:hypothetical protein CQ042_19780 [Microbacterium sp. MYb62]